jgi:nucleotide-binding universal stress UspA family protein
MLDSLALLAAKLHADLHGLYVEDANLVRLSEHTETSAYRFVSYGPSTGPSSGPGTAQAGMLARAVRAQAAQSRRIVEEVTRLRHIRTSFQVRQGNAVTEVLAAARDGDLIVIPKDLGAGRDMSSPATLSPEIVEGKAGGVLFFNPDAVFAAGVMTVYDGSAPADRALEAACDMAALGAREVEVVMLTPRLDAVEAWQNDIYNRVRTRGLEVSFLHLPETRVDQLCARSRRPQAGLMVLGVGQPLLEDASIDALFRRIDCSVLLVR